MNNKQIIEMAAMLLLTANGQTTTLDIKNHIRNSFPNIRIFQEEVSDHMLTWQDSGIFPDLQYKLVTTNGHQHRVYYLASAMISQTVVNPNQQLVAKSVSHTFSQPQYSSITSQPKYIINYNGIVYYDFTKDYLQKKIDAEKLPFRYSKSKDEFQNLELLNIHHLMNIYNKELNECTNSAERIAFFKGVVALTFTLRHSEIMAL